MITTPIRTVVHYVDSKTFGGCEEAVLQLLAGLDRNRWRPVLFHHDEPGISRLLNGAGQLGIPCCVVPRMNRRNIATAMRQFIRKLRGERTEIFHAHLNWPLACWHGVMAARLGRVRGIVATSQLFCPVPGARFGWLKQRLQAAALQRYIAVSNEVKERLHQELKVPKSKIQVVLNGIRLSQFERPADRSLRASLTGGSESPIVLTLARLDIQKGLVYLIEAAKSVPDAIFVLAGDGPERRVLEERANELGLSGQVRFLGHRKDIPELLASCDLFVLPSLNEGLPLSVLEAMAAGKPVIATGIGGTSEAVIDGETGLLVPPRNPDELAAAIRTVLADKVLAARLARAGRARAEKMFSSEIMARGVSQIYDELLTNRRRA